MNEDAEKFVKCIAQMLDAFIKHSCILSVKDDDHRMIMVKAVHKALLEAGIMDASTVSGYNHNSEYVRKYLGNFLITAY